MFGTDLTIELEISSCYSFDIEVKANQRKNDITGDGQYLVGLFTPRTGSTVHVGSGSLDSWADTILSMTTEHLKIHIVRSAGQYVLAKTGIDSFALCQGIEVPDNFPRGLVARRLASMVLGSAVALDDVAVAEIDLLKIALYSGSDLVEIGLRPIANHDLVI